MDNRTHLRSRAGDDRSTYHPRRHRGGNSHRETVVRILRDIFAVAVMVIGIIIVALARDIGQYR